MKETLFDIFPQVKKFPLATPVQIRDIINRLQQGDKLAEEELKNYFMRFVASVAKQYLDSNLTKNELLKAGTDGLITAGKNYSLNDKFKFVPYAVWYIRHSIVCAIRAD